MLKWLVVCLSFFSSGLVSFPLQAEQVLVAAASNFTAAMNEIAVQFEQETGHTVTLAFGSSGKFFAQIQNGAPFHVFFSADQAKPKALEDAGLIVPESRFTYAKGGLVLWSLKADLIDAKASVLKQGNFNKLALANPRLAPYGAAAVEVLDQLGLHKATRAQWVQGENISQTFQFIASGNADLGFVALSQVMVKGVINQGSYWIVPSQLYQPIRQDAVLLQKGKSNAAAKALLDFVKESKARSIIESYGYKS